MVPGDLIAMDSIRKAFGAVHALAGVDFHVDRGEVVGLIGHNGAGKSTLMNVLFGTTQRDSGRFHIAGREIAGAFTPHQAHEAGIRCVFQELSLCENLDVVENTRILHRSLQGIGWRRRARRLIADQLDAIFPGHGIALKARIADLPIGARQMVEIARAFTVTDAPLRCVILDEPTSSLGHEATRQFLAFVRQAAGQGVAAIVISHRLDEILNVCDRVVVMVDGRVVAQQRSEGLTRPDLVAMMGSIEVPRAVAKARDGSHDQTRDRVIDAPGRDAHDLPIHLAPGEIIGFAGLDGHGQRERMRALFHAGLKASRDRHRPAVAYVAGDRQTEGVFRIWSIADNLTIGTLPSLCRGPLISAAASRSLVEGWMARMKVKTDSADRPILSLSGGNQQKVLFARALASDARTVFLDDPMRGVDVGTKVEVYRLIRAEAAQGRSFVWYATELDELTNCDRIYVFREGRAVEHLEGTDIRQDRILAASFGGMVNA
ncbi:MAG: sugar ABC transporter ATP-binding protein [Azospirillaceae bacterium]|nr:sugar ABC transporter ATP-binding protein [Azospirillaceae bacterium]